MYSIEQSLQLCHQHENLLQMQGARLSWVLFILTGCLEKCVLCCERRKCYSHYSELTFCDNNLNLVIVRIVAMA